MFSTQLLTLNYQMYIYIYIYIYICILYSPQKGEQGCLYFTVVCLVAKPLIWSEAEGDLVVIETSIWLA